jgi:hypothetical protein
MTMKCIITIDTEADDQWKQDGAATLLNLDALARFQQFMEERGVPPTYLCSYETLTHPAIRELARAHAAGRAELGGHLHPWTTPPYDTLDEQVQRFPLEVPDNALSQKIQNLTEALSSLIGEQPLSFRAGRWGADARVYKHVYEAGYRVDSSVTPGINWKTIVRDAAKHTAIPNFETQTARPFMVPGTELIQVPMTVISTGAVSLPFITRIAHTRSWVGKIARLLARPRWCRIFPETTYADLVAVYEAAKRQQLPVLVFMIHSSELRVGTSPYVKTEAALEHVYELLERFIAHLQGEQVSFVRMREIGGGGIIA